jgi:broad specificity phosphatase PhoE
MYLMQGTVQIGIITLRASEIRTILPTMLLFSSLLLSSLPQTLAFTSKRACQGAFLHTTTGRQGWLLKKTERCLFASSSAEDAAEVSVLNISGPDLPPVEPMAKRLFLVRHGEVINPGGDRPVYYGAMDVPLSPLGEDEAKAAAAYLEQFDLEYVVSSPLSRAVFGAEQLLSMQSSDNSLETTADIVQLEGFRELDRGSWCGKTLDEIGPDLMGRFDACDESVTPEGGESRLYVKQRVREARDTVLDMLSAGRAAAIVSHLQVTRSMLSDALDIPTDEMATLKVATASVTCIDYDMVTGAQTVHFQSFKPDVGLEKSNDGAN